MIGGPILTVLAVALQSVGKVLYGTILVGISTPLFVLLSVCLTAAVFLVGGRFRMPREGRGLLVCANIWTAVGFISVFFALKHLPPAIFAAIEIGMSLLTAVALTSVQKRTWPAPVRILACLGIVGGCALLSWAEITASVSEPSSVLVWTAILACTATGVTSALSAITCKRLGTMGWTPTSTLAHRFYLTVAAALVWLPLQAGSVAMPSADALVLTGIVGAVAILVPLLLLQLALRRTDPVTVMVCMAAQPALSFALSIPSPAYDWSFVTLSGVLVVTLFVGWDLFAQAKARASSGTAR
jgi:drug/metabolite transporter (DMT)-like permease